MDTSAATSYIDLVVPEFAQPVGAVRDKVSASCCRFQHS